MRKAIIKRRVRTAAARRKVRPVRRPGVAGTVKRARAKRPGLPVRRRGRRPSARIGIARRRLARKRAVRRPALRRRRPRAVVRPGFGALQPGVTLIGYGRTEKGLGESLRAGARALEGAAVPFGIVGFEDGIVARKQDLSWAHKEIARPIHRANLIHMIPPDLQSAHHALGAAAFDGRYNIGYWHWELPEFPNEWCAYFQYVREVWVPSIFVLDAVSRKTTVPVVRIPHAIEVKLPDQALGREHFGLPHGPFLFLSMFDTHSRQERKNPEGAIHAFTRAFSPDDSSVGLVVKVTNADTTPNPDLLQRLRELAQAYPNIHLIERQMDRMEVNALIDATDSFVSLHRSEGFGLPLAEAMYLGKPVVGTGWSANMDFMNEMNACVVNYGLVRLEQDYGPYQAGQVWAEPDLEHAAYFMRRLARDTDWSRAVGRAGMQTIRQEYSPYAVGHMARQRLARLGLL